MGPCMDVRIDFTRHLPPEQRLPRTRTRISHFLTVVRFCSTNTDFSNPNCGSAIPTAVGSSLLCNNLDIGWASLTVLRSSMFCNDPDVDAAILTVALGRGSGGTDCHEPYNLIC